MNRKHLTFGVFSPPGGSLGQVAITSDLAISSASTAVAKPTNAPAQSNPRCATWYTVSLLLLLDHLFI